VSDLLTAVLLLPPFLATGHRLPSRIEVEAHCRRAATAPDSSFELLQTITHCTSYCTCFELPFSFPFYCTQGFNLNVPCSSDPSRRARIQDDCSSYPRPQRWNSQVSIILEHMSGSFCIVLLAQVLF
jgi:hypothetical protein